MYIYVCLIYDMKLCNMHIQHLFLRHPLGSLSACALDARTDKHSRTRVEDCTQGLLESKAIARVVAHPTMWQVTLFLALSLALFRFRSLPLSLLPIPLCGRSRPLSLALLFALFDARARALPLTRAVGRVAAYA